MQITTDNISEPFKSIFETAFRQNEILKNLYKEETEKILQALSKQTDNQTTINYN